jgi:NAD(P)-dependent dehydrogenase (short-subunit alcohol dehydrogenase family)
VTRFTSRVAVVTGAASGIGAATARRLAAEGARVVAVDLDEQRLASLDLPPGQLRVHADTADLEAIGDLVDRTLSRFGKIDVLVANAGIWQQRSFLDLDPAEWDRVIHVNLRGTFLVSQCVARAMVRAGCPGAIVITASTNGFVAEPDTAHYNASKGGLVMLAKSMAVDLAAHGIRVNAVAPGTIRTPLNSAVLDATTGPMAGATAAFAAPPAGRWGEPEECAAAIAYLASGDASYVTGTVLVVDGGQTALNGPAQPDSGWSPKG